MASLDDLLAGARLPEAVVRVCVRGDLAAEHAALSEELAALDARAASGPDTSSLAGLPDDDPRVAVALRLREVEAEMADTAAEVRLRALPAAKFREVKAAHPGKDGALFDTEPFLRALLSACSADPPMTPADVDRLAGAIREHDYVRLCDAAWTLNQGDQSAVPFSARASALTRGRVPR